MLLEDGKGKYGPMGTSESQRGNVSSRSSKRAFYASRDAGQAWTLTSIDPSAAAGTFVAYWKNTHTSKPLFIEHIIVGGVQTSLWKVWFVTGTAAGSSAITPTNMKKSGSSTPSATCRGEGPITGLTEAGLVAVRRVPANDSKLIDMESAIMLNEGEAIAVEYDTGTTGIAEVEMFGFYDDD